MDANVGGEACVYGCRHLLWGGAGTCEVAGHGDSANYVCSCEDGFISNDSLGNPSCVRETALLVIHMMVAVAGAVTAGFLLWNAMKQRGLSAFARPRRAMLRLRLIYSGSAFSASLSIVYGVAAAAGTLYGSGMLQALYCIPTPLSMIVILHVVDLWINALPSQLLPADSIATKVIQLAETKMVFVWLGRVGFVCLAVAGLLSTFALDLLTVVRCINVAVAIGAVSLVVCITFVGFHVTALINKAKSKANLSALAFYDQAIKALWIQVAALTSASLGGLATIVALELRLWGVGWRTPILPLSALAMIGCVVVGSAVHFAKVGPTSTARSPPRSTSRRGALWRPLVVPSNIGAKVKQAVSGGRPVTVIRVAAAAGRHSDSTASKVSTTTKTEIRVYSSPSSWSAQGKTRVIPLLTGGSNC